MRICTLEFKTILALLVVLQKYDIQIIIRNYIETEAIDMSFKSYELYTCVLATVLSLLLPNV